MVLEYEVEEREIVRRGSEGDTKEAFDFSSKVTFYKKNAKETQSLLSQVSSSQITPSQDCKEIVESQCKYSLESDSDSENASISPGKYDISSYSFQLDPGQSKKQNIKRTYFACQKNPEQLKTSNLNEHITSILEVLEKNSHSQGEKWRAFAYGKAIRVLKNAKFKVNSVEDAKKLHGIGLKIQEKIQEILETGQLRRVQLESSDERTVTFNLFSQVFGAGPATVTKWYSQGFRTLEDLKQKAKLTYQQEIGLAYYEELQQKIPREEVTQIGKIVSDTAIAIVPGLKVVVCGSYRRGRQECGDVDILMTHKKTNCLTDLLPRIIQELEKVHFLTDHLTKIENTDKYMGVCQRAPGMPHRRIDIKLFPRHEWACALLYFTGSGHFNRSIRLWARKLSMSLSEHALVRRYSETEKGEPVPVKSEQEIFQVLGLKYQAPEQRDI
uniref:DNA polymerase n=1 Tax=Arcella intermedia TaxID=1963864 RepID=A0A6B2L3W2_9EUKA